MCEPLNVFIALLGAVVLGFLLATSIFRKRYGQLSEEHTTVENSLRELNVSFSQLQAENQSKTEALSALQKTSHELEVKAHGFELEISNLLKENQLLKEEVTLLTNNPIEKIKEIDVIREVPILVFREISLPESRKEKALKLMYAFKKGYLEDHSTSTYQKSSTEVMK